MLSIDRELDAQSLHSYIDSVLLGKSTLCQMKYPSNMQLDCDNMWSSMIDYYQQQQQ